MKQVSNTKKFLVLSSPRHSVISQKSFPKYSFVFLLAAIAIFITSCQKEELQGNSQDQEFLISSQKQDQRNECVPLKGKFTFFRATSTGTGTASHIGGFTLVEPNNLVTPNEDGSLVIKGPATLTAANGDEIYATHVGLVQPLGNGTAQVNGEFTITGGTGRFARATGRFEVQGLSNLALGTGSFTMEGTICY